MQQKNSATELAAILNACPHARSRTLATFIVGLLSGPVKRKSMSSVAMKKAVGERAYTQHFLPLMDKLGRWIGRTPDYLSKESETKRRRAYCKSWYSKGLIDCQHIKKGSSFLSSACLARLSEFFCSDSDLLAAVELFQFFGASFNEFSVRSVFEKCKDETERQKINSEIDCFRRSQNGHGARVTVDGGGRIHNCLTRLPKYLRRCLQVEIVNSDGSVVLDEPVEVDGRCFHFALAALIYSPADERERILQLIRDNRFYESFGERDAAKKQLLTALFMYRCRLPAWQEFRKQFPLTVANIEEVRDSGPVIYDGPAYSKDGTKRHKTTYLGQHRISRTLTRAESEIFNRTIRRIYDEAGIIVTRIHDCIFGPASKVDIIKEFLEESFIHFWGRTLTVSVKQLGRNTDARLSRSTIPI